jgi:murein DD-endopeptidase MepM/ murein hydrolase activator NlpD
LKTLVVMAVLFSSVLAAQNPQILDLGVGESQRVALANGTAKTVRLLGYREQTEPYLRLGNRVFVDAVVSADVQVEVDGVTTTISGGPFRLPTTANGLSLLVATTKGWIGGSAPENFKKDVRLEAKDARLPWCEADRFLFPIRNYRWRATNYQHTWLGIVVNQRGLYYHRGEDMGMIPDLDYAVAVTDGVITKVPGPKGDGGSNAVVIEDATGLTFRYAHMNTPHILPELQPGIRVTKGQKLGLTGNTYGGGPVDDPHLHVEVRDQKSGALRNSFPLFVAAYLNSYPGSLLPIAGGWRHVWAGNTIELDGSRSLPAPGRKIVSYDWTFTDGKRVKKPRVRRYYARVGTYSEQLLVRDDRGQSDLDFVEVFVLDRERKSPPPYVWINYYPVRNIRPGTDVRFLTRYVSLRDLIIDFGDGTKVPYAEMTTHRYRRPGTYVVTVSGMDDGTGPGIFKVRVVVE